MYLLIGQAKNDKRTKWIEPIKLENCKWCGDESENKSSLSIEAQSIPLIISDENTIGSGRFNQINYLFVF